LRGISCAALLVGVTAAPSDPPRRGAFERRIETALPGKAVVVLDRDVYERARRDLGDLRVFDDRGRQVPYLLEGARDPVQPVPRQPRVLNRAFVRGESSSVTLDFGSPVLKSELALSLSGDNFRRRVAVFGRNRHDDRWETLTDGAYVFAVPPPAAARYETVLLPENNFQFLKVTVYDGPDDTAPVEIRQARARPQERRRPREQAMTVPLRADEDDRAHETRVVVDLGARHQPFRALVLDVADAQFFRGVVVEARVEPPPGRPPSREGPYWRPLAEGTVYRYEEGGGRAHEQLRVEACGRERMLRLRIRNRDDRPLQLRALTVLTPVERLVFDAEPGRTYALSYGSDALDAPVYDIARTVGDPAIWIAQAGEARLGEAGRRAEQAARAPWTERHPALLWAGLATLVLLLGTVTWRALRAAEGRPDEAAGDRAREP
jgi:hypothetical protein